MNPEVEQCLASVHLCQPVVDLATCNIPHPDDPQ